MLQLGIIEIMTLMILIILERDKAHASFLTVLDFPIRIIKHPTKKIDHNAQMNNKTIKRNVCVSDTARSFIAVVLVLLLFVLS